MLSNTDDAPLFQAIFSNCQVPLLVGIHCESSSSLAEESSDVLDKENIVDTKNWLFSEIDLQLDKVKNWFS